EGGPSAVHVGTGTLEWRAGNLTIDPVFAGASQPANPWRLSASSPCIDAGNNHLLRPDWTDSDSDGLLAEPIPHDRAGAQRRMGAPATPVTGIGPRVDQGAHEHRG